MSEDYVIGIDGGGTRSHGVAFAVNGEVLCRATGAALNFYTTTHAEFGANVEALCRQLQEGLSGRRCLRTVIGTASLFDRASDREHQAALGDMDVSGWGEVSLVGDAVTAVVGATGGSGGVLLISGTGSIAIRANRESEAFFSGGLGPALGGDPGSAFWMATQVLQEVQREHCRDGKIGPLGQFVFNYLEVDSVGAAISRCYSGSDGQKHFAGMARLLSETNDSSVSKRWKEIEKRAGEALAELVVPLLRQDTEMVSDLYILGSVLLQNSHVRSSLNQALADRLGTEIPVRAPRFVAAEGAVILALQECGLPIGPLIRRGLTEGKE